MIARWWERRKIKKKIKKLEVRQRAILMLFGQMDNETDKRYYAELHHENEANIALLRKVLESSN